MFYQNKFGNPEYLVYLWFTLIFIIMGLHITSPADFFEFRLKRTHNYEGYNNVFEKLFKEKKYNEAYNFHKEFLIETVEFAFTKFLIFKSIQILFLSLVLTSLMTTYYLTPLFLIISIGFLLLSNKERKFFGPIEADLSLMKMIIVADKQKNE